MVKMFLITLALIFSTFATSAASPATQARTLGQVFPEVEYVYGVGKPFGADCIALMLEPEATKSIGAVFVREEDYPEADMTLRLYHNPSNGVYLVTASSPMLPGASCLVFLGNPTQGG